MRLASQYHWCVHRCSHPYLISPHESDHHFFSQLPMILSKKQHNLPIAHTHWPLYQNFCNYHPVTTSMLLKIHRKEQETTTYERLPQLPWKLPRLEYFYKLDAKQPLKKNTRYQW